MKKLMSLVLLAGLMGLGSSANAQAEVSFSNLSADVRGFVREAAAQCLPGYIELTEKAFAQIATEFGATQPFDLKFEQYPEAAANRVQAIFENLEKEYGAAGGCVDTQFARSREHQSMRELTLSIAALWSFYNLVAPEFATEDEMLNPLVYVANDGRSDNGVSIALNGTYRPEHCLLVIETMPKVMTPTSADDFMVYEQCD
jgi:hypothetical protein